MTDDKCARATTCWGGGPYIFNLNHPWVRNVLAYRGIRDPLDTPAACLLRFEHAAYSDIDVERIIELGLIGGGMAERDVEALLDAHVRGQPLGPNAMIAMGVLAALFVGDANAART